jgi:aspartyl aminopeptidase
LNEQYGIVEKDFVSAEIEIVPSIKARDVGFDRSFVASYGHDDRVCAIPGLMALFQQSVRTRPVSSCCRTRKRSVHTAIPARSRDFMKFPRRALIKMNGVYDELLYRKTIAATKMLSAT